MTIQGQIIRYHAACNNLLKIFCDKHGLATKDVRWKEDIPGTSVTVGKYTIEMKDIIDDIASDAPPDALFLWKELLLTFIVPTSFAEWWDAENSNHILHLTTASSRQ